MRNKGIGLIVLLVVFMAGFALGDVLQPGDVVQAQSNRVFELRTYISKPGRLDDVQRRFRDHAAPILERHGIHNIGYWVPTDPPASENTLIYILAHDSRDAVKTNWDAFRADQEWQTAFEESRRNGPIFESVESVFMTATDFSQIK